MLQQVDRLFYGFILIVFFSFSLNTYGTTKNLDEKFQIEKAISERLEQSLKTRLDKAYFDISVDAQIKTTDTDLSQNPNTKVVYKANGEKDILQTWLLKEVSQAKKTVEFESIKITLSLSDQVRPDYREGLEKWLSNWTSVVLGSLASSEVLVRPTNILNKESDSDNIFSKVFTNLEAFQNLIGMFFLGLIFLIAFFKNRPAEIKKSAHTDTQKNEIITINSTQEIQKLSPAYSEHKYQENLKTLKIRLGVVGKTMSSQVEYLINRWASQDHENLLKIVALLEVLAENGSSLENLQIQSLPVLSKDASASLSKAFTDLQTMSNERRMELLEEIYMELVAGNLIRLSSSLQAFEFLEHLDASKIKEVFSHLRGPYQVSLLAKMSDSTKHNFINFVGPDFIKKLFEASLDTPQVSDQDLIEALKINGINMRKEKIWKSDFTEQSIQRVRKFWANISRKDEAMWLYQFMTINPDLKKFFENEKNHLVFLSDWPPHELRKFSLQTKTNELAAAMKALPHLKDPILNVCGIKMRSDVTEFMLNLEEPKLSKYFENFIATYDAYILSERSSVAEMPDLDSNNAA